MNKFDITELPKQWLVTLVALAFTFLLGVPGCAGGAAANGGQGGYAAAQGAPVGGGGYVGAVGPGPGGRGGERVAAGGEKDM